MLRGTRGSAVTAPSMSEPARKQVRWSCLGTSRQELGMVPLSIRRRAKVKAGVDVHFAIPMFLWLEFRSIGVAACLRFLEKVLLDGGHGVCVHLTRNWEIR